MWPGYRCLSYVGLELIEGNYSFNHNLGSTDLTFIFYMEYSPFQTEHAWCQEATWMMWDTSGYANIYTGQSRRLPNQNRILATNEGMLTRLNLLKALDAVKESFLAKHKTEKLTFQMD